MSWDVSFFAAEEPPLPMSEMSSDWRGSDFGPAEEVRTKISLSLPEVDWTDPTWGLYNGDTFSYEFNMGREEPSFGFMVHVRGSGDAVAPLVKLAKRWGWFMLDISEGEWAHHAADPESAWARFQEYRDQILSEKFNVD